METKANYVLIGAFTLLATLGLLVFALWAAKYASDKSWNRYKVIFNEPVTGLSEGSAVQFNGISVGTVEVLRLDRRDPRRVMATLKLEASTPVKVDTRAKMSQQGITGSPFIQLTGGSPSAPMLLVRSGDDIPIILTEPSALQNIADTANRLVARMDQVLSEENIRRINETLANIEGVTGAVHAQREDIRALLVNLRQASTDMRTTLQTTNGAVQRIDREVVARMPAVMQQLEQAAVALESASRNANALIAENRGPINQFSRDGLQQIGPTLSEIRSLLRDMRRVTHRIDGNPAGFLTGRQQPREFTPQ